MVLRGDRVEIGNSGWKPYLRVIREKCSQVLHILDRFHIVSNMIARRGGQKCRLIEGDF